MAAIVTNNFRISNAQQWVDQVSDTGSGSHYLFVGRPQPFALHTGGGNDQIPPDPVDNEDTNYMIWRDMIAARFIGESDVSIAIARHDWERDVAYDYYRSDYGTVVNGDTVTTLHGNWDMFEANSRMYVKAKHNVYKCLWNNYGALSIEEPTGKSVKAFTTADGYVWKFMYTLTGTDDVRFVTSDFIAVHIDDDVRAAAVHGAISQYHIANRGNGYEDGDYRNQPLVGDGEGGTYDVSIRNNEVVSVNAVHEGTGYTFAYLNMDDIPGIGIPQTPAWITPIIPPPGGHGFDPTRELGGFYGIANTILAGEEGQGDFVVDQEFRRLGLIKNPFEYGTETVATSDTLAALNSVTFHIGFSEFWANDERIEGSVSGATALVSHFTKDTGNLKFIQPQWSGEINVDGLDHDPKKSTVDFQVGETVTSESGATGVVRTVHPPEIEYYSGDVLYIENRTPITRAADQTENIKLIIEF